jgi:hypothetical protein
MSLPKFTASEIMDLAQMFGREKAQLEHRLAQSEEYNLPVSIDNDKARLKNLDVLTNKMACIELMSSDYWCNAFKYEVENYFNIYWAEMHGEMVNV